MVSKTLLSGIFVRNFTQHCRKFLDNFLGSAGDKIPSEELEGIKNIFGNLFADIKKIGKSSKSNRNIPSQTKSLANELFSSEIDPENELTRLKLQSLKSELSSLNTGWKIEELKNIENRNKTGEDITQRETYDVLNDPYSSPATSPKKKAYIETLEYGHSERKEFEFITDINKLIVDKQILQIPGWKNGGKFTTLK